MALRALSFLLAGILVIAFTGCPNGETETTTPDAPDTATEVEDGVRTVTISPVGNEMRYQQTEIRARPGETIRVVMQNTASSPAMYHNVLFLTDREYVAEVGNAAIDYAAQDFIPDHPAILGSTPMAAPGETTEFEFTVPDEPGEYPFICTYPGHWSMMQGTLYVEDQ